MHQGNHLVGDHWSGQSLPDRLVEGGQVALADQADIALAQHHIPRFDNGGTAQWPGGGHDIAKQADLSGYEHSPGGGALAADLDRDPSQRPGTLQRGCQFLVAHGHVHARVERVDLDLVATFRLTGCQIVLYGEFKKALSDADKHVRQGNRVSKGRAASVEQANSRQHAEQFAVGCGQASKKCRFCVHND
ncbi:hypothetical protein D3C71_883710 [compost metagenome]